MRKDDARMQNNYDRADHENAYKEIYRFCSCVFLSFGFLDMESLWFSWPVRWRCPYSFGRSFAMAS